MSQIELSPFQKLASQRARHRALIMQILNDTPGLTTQQIIMEEHTRFGYQFLTDNRLRELRSRARAQKAFGGLKW